MSRSSILSNMDTRYLAKKRVRRLHRKRIRADRHYSRIKKKRRPPTKYNNILLLSSLIFITNVITALYKQYYIYATLFTLLTITSQFFHSSKSMMTNAADKIMIFSVVFYGGNMLYTKMGMQGFHPLLGIVITTTFLFCIISYYYGYICNKYCFDPDNNVGNMYHAMLHIIASVGHHMIIMA